MQSSGSHCITVAQQCRDNQVWLASVRAWPRERVEIYMAPQELQAEG